MIILQRLNKTRVLLFVGGLGVAMIVASALIGRNATDAAAGLPVIAAATPPGVTLPSEAPPTDSTAAAGFTADDDASRPGVTLPNEAPPTDSTNAVQTSDCTLDAVYQADVTIPDNTFLKMGEPFVKTWRILNTGTCAWGSGYRLQFAAGTQMGGPDAVSVAETPPGGSVEVSVGLVAPAGRGAYRGDWQMRSDKGVPFGQLLYIQIIVYDPSEQ